MRKMTIYLALMALSLLFVMPLAWTLLTALKSRPELYIYPPQILPEVARWDNFPRAWNIQPFATYTLNTLTVVVFSTIGQLFSSSLVAYGFARFSFPGRNAIFVILLSTMMIPWEAKMIPLYMEFNLLGWINSLKPLIIPAYFGEAYFIFLLRQYVASIPRELDEAAHIDGANAWQIYWHIHLPLMVPPLILVGTLHFINAWNDYLGPLIYLNDQSKYTLTLGLALFKTAHSSDVIGIAAITVLMCVPPLVLFFFMQKYITGNALSGGVKG